MLGLRAEPQPCTELPTRAMSRLLKHCCRQGLTRLYRNDAETSHSQPLLNLISYYRMTRGEPVHIKP